MADQSMWPRLQDRPDEPYVWSSTGNFPFSCGELVDVVYARLTGQETTLEFRQPDWTAGPPEFPGV